MLGEIITRKLHAWSEKRSCGWEVGGGRWTTLNKLSTTAEDKLEQWTTATTTFHCCYCVQWYCWCWCCCYYCLCMIKVKRESLRSAAGHDAELLVLALRMMLLRSNLVEAPMCLHERTLLLMLFCYRRCCCCSALTWAISWVRLFHYYFHWTSGTLGAKLNNG